MTTTMTIVENTSSTLSKNNTVNCDYTHDANSLMKSKSKTHKVLVVEDAFAVGSPIQNPPCSAQKRKPLNVLASSLDCLHHLLNSFARFAQDNPGLSPAGKLSTQCTSYNFSFLTLKLSVWVRRSFASLQGPTVNTTVR